jgi:hypothetical protein
MIKWSFIYTQKVDRENLRINDIRIILYKNLYAQWGLQRHHIETDIKQIWCDYTGSVHLNQDAGQLLDFVNWQLA